MEKLKDLVTLPSSYPPTAKTDKKTFLMNLDMSITCVKDWPFSLESASSNRVWYGIKLKNGCLIRPGKKPVHAYKLNEYAFVADVDGQKLIFLIHMSDNLHYGVIGSHEPINDFYDDGIFYGWFNDRIWIRNGKKGGCMIQVYLPGKKQMFATYVNSLIWKPFVEFHQEIPKKIKLDGNMMGFELPLMKPHVFKQKGNSIKKKWEDLEDDSCIWIKGNVFLDKYPAEILNDYAFLAAIEGEGISLFYEEGNTVHRVIVDSGEKFNIFDITEIVTVTHPNEGITIYEGIMTYAIQVGNYITFVNEEEWVYSGGHCVSPCTPLAN